MKNHAKPNALIHSTSPYLLQHAHNPVEWYPWGEEALKKAQTEDKLMIVSIGYSSCHWCHVMEKESFEDEGVARFMNAHFVCIKVDREERPDLDHLYMTAVQMLDQQGGWPLNCITLPDGRPVWGGTYFPKEQWLDVLQQLQEYYANRREEVIRYASNLEEGIRQQALVSSGNKKTPIATEELHQAVRSWIPLLDPDHGGTRGAPKFPMPVHLQFLLHYGVQCSNEQVLQHVERTLNRMSEGGIYDQVGGGFSRYSVDARWRIPHFEKMLYDNAQLIGLYASAYKVFGHKHYRRVVEQSIEWVKRDMVSPEGAFFTALDADSEGEEGKYYAWTEQELREVFGEEYELFAACYRVGEASQWEAGTHILQRNPRPEEVAEKFGITPDLLHGKMETWNRLLLSRRKKRIAPGLDDKSLTSWSSLMISGLVEAYRALGKPEYLETATRAASLIRDLCWDGEERLYRNYKNRQASIPGFHTDYALYLEACLNLYEVSLDQNWLDVAMKLNEAATRLFFDDVSGFYQFVHGGSDVLITNHAEIQDQVIPSSNAVMAHNLFRLGHLMGAPEYLERAHSMGSLVQERFQQHPYGFANWGRLFLLQHFPFYEVAVTGASAFDLVGRILKDYQPNILVAGTTRPSDLPLFRNRLKKDKTLIFVCRDHACLIPVEHPEDATKIYHIQ